MTTHNLDIFRYFCEHKMHDFLKEDLIIYIDKTDADAQPFLKLLQYDATFFTKGDMIDFYGDKYLQQIPFFNKVYFLNMLYEKGLLDRKFYFTDDDILVYDESLINVDNEDKIIYIKEGPQIIDRYDKWPKMKEWLANNKEVLKAGATNFFIPQRYIKEYGEKFHTKFKEFLEILIEDKAYLSSLNAKSKSERGCDFALFFLDSKFMYHIYPDVEPENYKPMAIRCISYSQFRHIRDHLGTNNTYQILEKYFKNIKGYDKTQPLVHFNVTKKAPLMRACYEFLNGDSIKFSDIDDILKHNPREIKFLKNKRKPKSLF